jgi:hypothetical protein
MSAIGGSVQNVNIAGRDFAPVGDGEAQIKLGGFEAETQPNGNGTARKILTRIAWGVTGLALEFDSGIQDQEFLQAIAESDVDEPFTITLRSGVTYQGIGTVSGELQGSSQSASGTVEFSGPGKLTQQ